MRGKLFRSIWSTVRRWRTCAATISATPKVTGSTPGETPACRWSIPTSFTAWCCHLPRLWPASALASSWITLPPRSPPSRERLQAIDRFAWPGLEEQVFAEPFAPAARFFREHCYDPRQVLLLGATAIRQQCEASALSADDGDAWVE